MLTRVLPSALIVGVVANPSTAHGQCGQWSAAHGAEALSNGSVGALALWDPDGQGGLAPVVAVAGSIHLPGSILNVKIAAWQPETGEWTPFGDGLEEVVRALCVLPDGQLVAGGYITESGETTLNRIARWNGAEWLPLGLGLGPPPSASVDALAATSDGVFAGGTFTTAGGQNISHIARWADETWSPLGSGVSSWVFAIEPRGTELYVGGIFGSAGGTTCGNIARWDGSRWSRVGWGVDGYILALHAAANGDLFATGEFDRVGTSPQSMIAANNIARWDGHSWSPLGSGINDRGFVLTTLENGDLIVGGEFDTAGGNPARKIARWNGEEWFPLGLGTDGFVGSLAWLPDGDLLVGGDFMTAGGHNSLGLARWRPCCPGDLNCNCAVDIQDLATLLAHFATDGASGADGDMDNDGDVDLQDLALLLAVFGDTACE